MNCQICQQPLSNDELSLNHEWHAECEVCYFCKAALPNSDQIRKCLAAGRPVSHDMCFKNALAQDFREHKIPLYQSHIDMLNEEILSVYPPIDPTSIDFETLNKLYHRLKECTVNVSTAMDLTREKIKIQTNNKWREEELEKAQTRRKTAATERVHQAESAERQEMLKKEREDPALRLRRKAIEGLMASGLSKEQAETFLNGSTGQRQ